jgi:hypothetical protein
MTLSVYKTGSINPKTGRFNVGGMLYVNDIGNGMFHCRHQTSIERSVTNTPDIVKQWLSELLTGLGDALSENSIDLTKKMRHQNGAPYGSDVLNIFS